jgi:acetate kinase
VKWENLFLDAPLWRFFSMSYYGDKLTNAAADGPNDFRHTMRVDLLLTLNAGSSTIKIGLFEAVQTRACRVARGLIDLRRHPASFHITEGAPTFDADLKAEASDIRGIVLEAFGWLAAHFDISGLSAVGHRVVHGGDSFAGPVRIDDGALDAIDKLTMLAPLHQPQSVSLIRAIRHLRSDLIQVASFDTAFHRTNAEVVRRFAVPRALYDEGIKRYGFHGLSYKYIAGELMRRAPELASGKIVVAHLGSGASLCALDAGVSRDTSMGFSTLDGIPMATRCGALDAGALLHLLGPIGRTLADVSDMLYHESGVLGVSGISADTRELLMSDRLEARCAIDVFTFRIAGEVARLATTLGGLDGIVFTAGIGENQPQIRAEICKRLVWLGAELDGSANARNAEKISSKSSRIVAFVIPTDEEQVMADEALSVLGHKERTRAGSID